ncbi:unnamed protein product [Rotaria sp. Silwood2]|nr:unnamed protein product [Rotaria sp. Silwood2]CAF2547722.1 unnamed protein product [Rotaria sp. Silwood2]CAF2798763.1 unnamed protein product [Rotaria sp. Silwood2]CAF2944066.1 unnamed protein product [Rotaria sp. Silwood2]CAF3911348.1 unnamed protein product [Rotaria sp. Silwood2]
MKSIIIFHLLITFTVYFPSIFSYSNHNVRLYNLLRTPVSMKDNAFVLPTRSNKDTFTSVLNRQLNSIEDEENVQTRNSWDSGEDYYFQWAKQNRRPVEYFTGRKRETAQVITPTRRRYDHDGLWRSGLVG